MKTAIAKVKEFHAAFGQPIGSVRSPDISIDRTLRLDLIAEEFRELAQALHDNDVVGVADGLGDLAYVVIGAAIEWGIPLDEVVNEIHRSNMSKVGGGRRDDGKILKGPNYSPPNLAAVLERAAVDDAVNPSHYRRSGVEPIDAIEAWDLGFCLANVVKYVARCGHKPGANPLDDLKKARWYLDREIQRIERQHSEYDDLKGQSSVDIVGSPVLISYDVDHNIECAAAGFSEPSSTCSAGCPVAIVSTESRHGR